MMNIKRLILASFAAALVCGCAKEASSGLNDANKRYFDAWITTNHPEATRIEPGIYVIDEQKGDGIALDDEETYPYIYFTYNKKGLDGTYSEVCEEKLAKQVGSYNEQYYYGPIIADRANVILTSGIEAAFYHMKEGGKMTVAIPGWLSTTSRYGTEEGYLKHESGDDSIYNIEILKAISDINQWQIDSIENYLSSNNAPVDSLKWGFYYVQTKAPSADAPELTKDDVVTINYTGSLLNGKIFDTNIETVAKDAGLYSSSSSYIPRYIVLAEDVSDIVMSTGEENDEGEVEKIELIEGFSYLVTKMRLGEKGYGIFYSELGYGGSSQGQSIPAYSPLRFDIEILTSEKQ